MRAVAVYQKEEKIQLLDHPAPQISADHEVKVKVLEVGVCGTDREICTFVYGAPPAGSSYLVIGHEALGEVVEVGSAVADVKKGDLVVPSVRRPCHHADCQPCAQGLQDFCATGDFVERGIKMYHGYMTEYFVDGPQFLNRVPADLRDVAVLVEPLTVAEKGLAQVWKTQERLPWVRKNATPERPGEGLNAVVLGAGPIGILGAMALVARGFRTFVYSRSPKPNPKSALVESFGAEYISAKQVSADDMAARVGNIDLIYEASGISSFNFDVMLQLGQNGIYIFTGIPAPGKSIAVMGDQLMRNIVLKNQAVVGTVNADRGAFANAIKDLAYFKAHWPEALGQIITSRKPIEDYRDLLVGEEKGGIKNVISLH